MSELRNQVMWNRLISSVEDQALALVRAAFSTSVREAGDLSAGVYDVEGRMIAQAITGTPGHVNTMAAAVANFIEDAGAAAMERRRRAAAWAVSGLLATFAALARAALAGCLPVPEGPGLGSSIDEDWVAANPWDDSGIWTFPPGGVPPRQQVAWP